MVPRRKQQLGGLLMVLVGGGFTGWTWYTALTGEYYFRKASMLFPAFCVLGLGMILFPSYKEERLARGEDLSGLSGAQLLTPRWWIIVVLALMAGFGNYLMLSAR